MDPLSDVLSLLMPQSYMSGGFDAGGDWSFLFQRYDCARCFALVSGQCWLSVGGLGDAMKLEAGDCVVLPHGHACRLASNLELTPIDVKSLLAGPLNGHILSWNGGGACLGLCAYFTFAQDHASVLLSLLPAIVHIRNETDRAAMRWYLERMMRVLREPQPGGVLLGQHLAQMMLVEALRLYIAESAKDGAGWLFALADKQLSAAISALHDNPGYRWSLQELAERAGMSRSVFALRFREKVGVPAMEYLTRWRMLRAADRLVHSSDSVLAIAQSFGYASESAFGLAFKKVMGCSPRRYCHGRTTSLPAPAPLEEPGEALLQEAADITFRDTEGRLRLDGTLLRKESVEELPQALGSWKP
jgi:AraC-like DNA-binding protein